jgi:response regulator RpfG family c-di-GMP phosphodiesterase
MEIGIPFLIVDDEDSSIATLKSLITKAFPKSEIKVEQDGISAFDYIQRNLAPMIVICDYNIPGINGLQIIKKIRAKEHGEQVFFMIITANADKELNIKTLQSGADDFINRPFSVDELLGKMRLAVRIITQLINNKELFASVTELTNELKLDATKMKDLIISILETKIPDFVKITKFYSDASVWIASELGEVDNEEIKEIESAAQLCLTGKLSLADSLIEKPVLSDGLPSNEKMAAIPGNAQKMLSQIRGFDKVTQIVYHIYENYDGSGIPDKIKGWQIPLGSRILRAVMDYYELVNIKKLSSSKAIEQLELQSRRLYDFRIVALIDQFNATQGIGHAREKAIRYKELAEDMIISRNLVTQSGLKIMGAGSKMDIEKIEKIITIITSDPLIGKIYVYY